MQVATTATRALERIDYVLNEHLRFGQHLIQFAFVEHIYPVLPNFD